MISRTGMIYLPAMLLAGIAVAVVLEWRPQWREAEIPPAAWPLPISLLFELALSPLVARGSVEPLTMGERFTGVVGAALVIIASLARHA